MDAVDELVGEELFDDGDGGGGEFGGVVDGGLGVGGAADDVEECAAGEAHGWGGGFHEVGHDVDEVGEWVTAV